MPAFFRSLLIGLTLAPVLTPASAAPQLEPIAGAAATAPPPWHIVGLPRQTKPFTRFSVVDLDGRRAVKIEADESYGNLVHPLAAIAAPARLAWRWRVEQPIPRADLHEKSGDDNAVKVCASFDEPLDRISFGERQLLNVGRSRTDEPVPSATVCYVWDPHLPAGTTIDNAFSRRIRYIVLESGDASLGKWVSERRDLAADFTRVFGAECPVVPPLVSVAVGADSDNTKSHSLSYVSDLVLEVDAAR